MMLTILKEELLYRKSISPRRKGPFQVVKGGGDVDIHGHRSTDYLENQFPYWIAVNCISRYVTNNYGWLNLPVYQCPHVVVERIVRWWQQCSSVGWRMRHVPRLSDISVPDQCRSLHNTHPRTDDPWSLPAPLKYQRIQFFFTFYHLNFIFFFFFQFIIRTALV